MSIKKCIAGFIITYILISLPAIFGFGYVIDWIPEATNLQKFKGYVFYGLTNGYLFKSVVSILMSAAVDLLISKRKSKEQM